MASALKAGAVAGGRDHKELLTLYVKDFNKVTLKWQPRALPEALTVRV